MDYPRNPNTACIICNKPVYKRPVILKKNKGNAFCSSTYYGKFIRKETPCLVCGKPIMARFNKKTCSRACANKHRTGVKYKLGAPRKDKVKYLRQLKIRLLEIRAHKCERCAYNKVEVLQIHHKDKNPENNDLSNLELICPNCHYEEHLLEKSWLKRYNLGSQGGVLRMVRNRS